jgi:hypothetical protein
VRIDENLMEGENTKFFYHIRKTPDCLNAKNQRGMSGCRADHAKGVLAVSFRGSLGHSRLVRALRAENLYPGDYQKK